jgi:hypothetical protein
MAAHAKQQMFTSTSDEFNQTFSQSQCPSVLTEIYTQTNNIVIWKYQASDKLVTNIETFVQQNPAINIAKIIDANTAALDIKTLLTPFEFADAVAEHICELVDMFCCLFDLKQAGLRLSKLEHAMCPRFHVDRVPFRLVTTLYGSNGTQWLPHHVVNRQKLGFGNGGMPDELSGLYPEENCIQNLELFDVALLKGETWDGNEGRGLVHRSPAATKTSQRLVLTLDFVS